MRVLIVACLLLATSLTAGCLDNIQPQDQTTLPPGCYEGVPDEEPEVCSITPPATNNTTSDDNTSTSTNLSGVEYAFFAVHLDPGSPTTVSGEPNDERPLEYLDDLLDLVASANEGGHHLTLMFTPQWANHLTGTDCETPDDGDGDDQYQYGETEYSVCLDLIRAIEADGHAIAFLHHSQSAPASWDGYGHGNISEPHYLGNLSDAKGEVDALSATGGSSVVSGSSQEFPAGGGNISFTSARGWDSYVDADDRGDLASKPCAWTEDNNSVWRMRMRSYTNSTNHDIVRSEVTQAIVDLTESDEDGWTLGFISQAKDVGETEILDYGALFDLLSDSGITLETLPQVAAHYNWTAGDPADDDGTHACPADEGATGPSDDEVEVEPDYGPWEGDMVYPMRALARELEGEWIEWALHDHFNNTWNGTTSGEENGSDSKWILIEFLSTDCGHCWNAADDMTSFHNDYGDRVEFLSFAVNFSSNDYFNATPEEVAAFQDKTTHNGCRANQYDCADRPGEPHDWLYVDDRNQSAMHEFAAQGTPMFVIIQPNGVVAWHQYQHNGDAGEDQESIVDALQRFFGQVQ